MAVYDSNEVHISKAISGGKKQPPMPIPGQPAKTTKKKAKKKAK